MRDGEIRDPRNCAFRPAEDLPRCEAAGGGTGCFTATQIRTLEAILMYFGWADPALNPLMGVQYYEQVTQRMGPSTPEFFKLYMVPGMFHCGGGIGTSAFDAFTPLVEWVEKGIAPSAITAGRDADGKVDRTRPLCPYPQEARYQGTGSIDNAANFACADPDITGPPQLLCGAIDRASAPRT